MRMLTLFTLTPNQRSVDRSIVFILDVLNGQQLQCCRVEMKRNRVNMNTVEDGLVAPKQEHSRWEENQHHPDPPEEIQQYHKSPLECLAGSCLDWCSVLLLCKRRCAPSPSGNRTPEHSCITLWIWGHFCCAVLRYFTKCCEFVRVAELCTIG